MDESKKQSEYYNRSREIKYEQYLRDPEALRGISLPKAYFKPHRILLEKLNGRRQSGVQGLRIVELGAGTGDWSCYLASLGASVVSLDISEICVKIASLRARRNGLSSLRAVVGSCTDTGLQAEDFDIAFGVGLIHHLTVAQERELYCELLRVLKPGGSAFFVEPLTNSPTLDYLRTLLPVFQRHNPRPSRLSRSWKAFAESDPHPPRPNSTKHYRETLRSFGFSSVDLIEVGVLSRCDRLTSNKNLRRWIHDFDYAVSPVIPFRSLLARNIVIMLRK